MSKRPHSFVFNSACSSSFFLTSFCSLLLSPTLFSPLSPTISYSLFSDDPHTRNTDARSRKIADLVRQRPSQKAADALAKEQGLRYSILNEVVSYNPVSSVALDIMHALHLGVNKHSFVVLVVPHLKAIGAKLDMRVKSMSDYMASNIGRFPNGISDYYKSFKAVQWRNFFLYYAEHCLEGLVTPEVYACLLSLVHANRMWLETPMTRTVVDAADSHYRDFFSKFTTLAPKRVVYKLHACLHFTAIIQRLGPPSAYALYGVERDMGRFQKFSLSSNTQLEKQLVRWVIMTGGFHSLIMLSERLFTERQNGRVCVVSVLWYRTLMCFAVLIVRNCIATVQSVVYDTYA